MAFEDINFPVYRKYRNGKSYFKILSRHEFEEIQLIGNKKIKNSIKANQLPEMNHIYDLVYNKEVALEITHEEYEKINGD